MRTVSLVLACCLICLSHGRRVQLSMVQLQSSSPSERKQSLLDLDIIRVGNSSHSTNLFALQPALMRPAAISGNRALLSRVRSSADNAEIPADSVDRIATAADEATVQGPFDTVEDIFPVRSPAKKGKVEHKADIERVEGEQKDQHQSHHPSIDDSEAVQNRPWYFRLSIGLLDVFVSVATFFGMLFASTIGRVFRKRTTNEAINDSDHRVFPCGDELDSRITTLALPAIINYLILPITNAADLFYIGKLGSSLAIAGQATANQIFSTASWTITMIPTVMTPRVAKAKAAGDEAEVQTAIGEAFFVTGVLSCILGVAISFHKEATLLAAGSASGLPFSFPYLTWRLPGFVFDSLSTIGFSAFRGVMDTVTPLRISAVANLINIGLDPALMFSKLGTLPGGVVVRGAGLGMAGAALATTVSQLFAAVCFIWILLSRKLVRWGTLLRVPSRASLTALAKAGGAVQVRALALNAAFFSITKATMRLDTTGTAAAAHAVTIQLWQLGGVILFALSTVASIIVPAELAKKENGGVVAARTAANRILAWSFIASCLLAIGQIAALPLLGIFTPLPEVQRAARVPSIMGASLQLLNGLTFTGEGLMVGTGSFGPLALGQVFATTAMLGMLSLGPFANSLVGIWSTFYVFIAIRFANVVRHHFFTGPLAAAKSGKQLPEG